MNGKWKSAYLFKAYRKLEILDLVKFITCTLVLYLTKVPGNQGTHDKLNQIKNKNEKRSEGVEHDVKNFHEDIIGN